MNWFKTLLSKLFGKKDSKWDEANYGKPSNAGDDFRKINET